MKYLVLAVLSSAAISVLLRIGEIYIKNKIAMFMVNYLICVVMSTIYMGGLSVLQVEEGKAFAMGLGVLAGIMFLVCFLMLQYNIERNGMVLASVFMRLGVLVPVVIAVAAFREMPRLTQIAGFVLAVLAILIINLDPHVRVGRKASARIWLIVLLLVNGLTDSLANVYDKMGSADAKDLYLLSTFFVAMLVCIGILFIKKSKIHIMDLVFGVLVGVPNYYSARFLLLALTQIPAVVTYPAYNVATIVVISAAGLLFFKERLNRRKSLGLLLILVALVLLNL